MTLLFDCSLRLRLEFVQDNGLRISTLKMLLYLIDVFFPVPSRTHQLIRFFLDITGPIVVAVGLQCIGFFGQTHFSQVVVGG